jgi:hypothetical protein
VLFEELTAFAGGDRALDLGLSPDLPLVRS